MAEVAVRAAGVERATEQRGKGVITREFRFVGVFIFAITSIGLTYGGLLPFSTLAGLLPGVNLVWVITVAALAGLVHSYTYAAMGGVAGRNGSDYYVASRLLSPPLAFASSFLSVIFFALAGGTIIASIPQTILPMFIRVYSMITEDKLLLDNILLINTPSGIVLWGTLGVLIVFAFLLLPPKSTQRLLLFYAGLGIIAWSILFSQLVSAPVGSFSTAWNHYMGDGSYQDHLYQARQLGIQLDFRPGTTILAGLTLGFWIFYGYFNATFFVSEVRQPDKNLLRGSWLALIIGGGVLIVTTLLVQRHIPLEWLASESFLSRTPAFTGQTMPWLIFYAAILNPIPYLVGIVGVMWVFGMLTIAQTFLYSGSRIMLAWADDGLLPSVIATIHPSMKSPLVAILLMAIVAIIGVIDVAFSKAMPSANPIFIMAITQVLPVLAMIILPFKAKDWFKSAPPLVRWKLGPLPLVSLIGLLSLTYLIEMIVMITSNPIFGGLDSTTIRVVVFSGLSALVWYSGRWAYLKSRGESYDFSLKAAPDLDNTDQASD